jgi:hypothetical protein
VVDQKPVDLHGALRVEPGQDSLEIHYTGLSFIKPEQIVFRYRLEGLDNEVEHGRRILREVHPRRVRSHAKPAKRVTA